MLYQAHQGVCAEYPGNTLPAFEGALLQGYDYIEADPAFTKDGICVVFHDLTLSRTCRNPDGSQLAQDLKIGELTYEQVLYFDAGIAKGRKFAGTKIPLLSQLLSIAREGGVTVKLDNRICDFNEKETEILYGLVETSGAKAAFTCPTVKAARRVLGHFPDAEIHYDGRVDIPTLEQLSELVRENKLFIWLAMDNRKTRWVQIPHASATLCREVKKYAQLGIWIIDTEEELQEAADLGADIIETAGYLKPKRPGRPYDCHTHSLFSHDSECLPEDSMQAAQKHLSGFAVTDHCDIEFCHNQDVKKPILASVAAVDNLKGKHGVEMFSGVEIGEGIWYPKTTDEVLASADFDVILGSVHAVRSPGLTQPYSRIDFSRLSDSRIAEYLKAYFRDMEEMVDTQDFDVLAHLDCPLRYICGKYGRRVELDAYANQIDKILGKIIAHSIALEINTAGTDPADFCLHPGAKILARYRALGGYLITLGSDAHAAENVGHAFPEALRALQGLGFENAYYYTRRWPVQYDITLN